MCCLVQVEPRRWNSSYNMLKKLIEQKKALSAAANAEMNESIDLLSSRWKLAEKVVNLLQLFEEAREDIIYSSSSVALVIPILNSLKRLLAVVEDDTGIMAMKRKMAKSVAECFENYEMKELYFMSTILDPRFKNKVFSHHPSAINL